MENRRPQRRISDKEVYEMIERLKKAEVNDEKCVADGLITSLAL